MCHAHTHTVEADTLKRITDLQASITDEGSAEYVTRRRQEMEGAIRAADADVSRLVCVCGGVRVCADIVCRQYAGATARPVAAAAGVDCRMGCVLACWGRRSVGNVSRAFL